MKILLRQSLFFILLLFFSLNSFGQDNKFSFRFEYVPSYSLLTNPYLSSDYKLSFQIGLGVDYELKEKITYTMGLFFLNTGETLNSSYEGATGTIDAIYRYNFNYLTIPLGLKFNFNSFYVHPEIGFAFSFLDRYKKILIDPAGEKEVMVDDEYPSGGELNNVTFPLMLTVGNELDLGKLHLLLGIKGTYGLNPVWNKWVRDRHYYSFGLLLGVKL